MLFLAKKTVSEVKEVDKLTEDETLADILAQTEHLRWNAFHVFMGYSQITIEEMHSRFEKYKGEKNTREHLEYCRRDTKSKKHACLVSWDELDNVSKTYRELAERASFEKEYNRDFKENDRDIINFIPKLLKEAVILKQ
jgi:membrane-anchored protein YejM (alkaline phosphatase superfamily)